MTGRRAGHERVDHRDCISTAAAAAAAAAAITRAVLSLARFIRARHENKTATLTSYNDCTRQERNAVLYSTCRVWPGITRAQRHMQVYMHYTNEIRIITSCILFRNKQATKKLPVLSNVDCATNHALFKR